MSILRQCCDVLIVPEVLAEQRIALAGLCFERGGLQYHYLAPLLLNQFQLLQPFECPRYSLSAYTQDRSDGLMRGIELDLSSAPQCQQDCLCDLLFDGVISITQARLGGIPHDRIGVI